MKKSTRPLWSSYILPSFVSGFISFILIASINSSLENLNSVLIFFISLLVTSIVFSTLVFLNFRFAEKIAAPLSLNGEMIKHKEDLLGEVQKISHTAFFEWDLLTDNIHWSDEFLKIYEYPGDPKEFSFTKFIEMTHPEDKEKLRTKIQKAIENKTSFNTEYRIITSGSKQKPLILKGKIFLDRHSKPIRILAFIEDITERKWAEEEMENKNLAILNAYKKLEKSQEELKKLNNDLEKRVEERTRELSLSEEKFRILGESIPQMVWSAQPDGSIDFFNNQWYNFTGQKADQSLGWNWAEAIYPEDHNKAVEKWKSALQKGGEFENEFRLKNKEQKFKWHMVRAHPLKNKNGEIIKWFGSYTDIDESKKAHLRKDEFIGIASHELKTPLTSIKAYIQLLKLTLEGYNDEKVQVYLNRTNSYVDKLNNLIVDLLDVSKIQAGKLQFNLKEIYFDSFAYETLENIQNTSSTHKIIVRGKTNAILSGDEQRIEQVFINFITNAIKYSPDADRVEVELSEKNGNVEVAIRDYGIGIPKDKVSKIFDRFYRVDNLSSKFTGLGIGLFITSEIIKRHKGNIWVNSEEGKGSTFYFSLPIAKKK